MPTIDDKNETEDDEMDADSGDSEKSDDEEDTVSGSEEDSSAELDEEECERRREECLNDMADLERQFTGIKEQLHCERITEIDKKLVEMGEERAQEYLQPAEELQEDMKIRIEVAEIWKELELINIHNKFECEDKATRENYESDKIILFDTVKAELEEKIRRLEEDRHNIDISSDLWNESQQNIKKKRKHDVGSSDRRRKPVTVTGPYIVYLLKDIEIIEDWTTIKKALKQSAQKRKSDCFVYKTEKHPYTARYDDGKLYYEGEWYSRGHHIIIDNREDSPVHATVTAINTGEVWVKRSDGCKSKLYIAQLQKGKYTVRHVPY